MSSDQSQAFLAITKRLSAGVMAIGRAQREYSNSEARRERMYRLHEESIDLPQVKAAAGKKRKCTDQEAPNLDDIEIPDGTVLKMNAKQCRGKIRTYLASGEMTVGKFCEAIDVSSNSYYNFMNQSGPSKGIYSDTFQGAAEFFMKRQIAGLGMPRKKKAKADDTNTSEIKDTAATKKLGRDDFDVSGIELGGQDKDNVPVFDTPQDVRLKINEHLRNTSESQASLVRALKAQYTTAPAKGISPAALKTFLSASGHGHGTSSPITYAGYMYFEKLRIKHGKNKSKRREEMEQLWGRNEMSSNFDAGVKMWMGPSDMLYTSQYGEVEIIRRNGKPPNETKNGVTRTWKCYGR